MVHFPNDIKLFFFKPILPMGCVAPVTLIVQENEKTTHGDGHTKSKLGAISGPTKRILVQQKILKIKNKKVFGTQFSILNITL